MSTTTLTFRLDAALRKELEQRARVQRQTLSEFVRRTLESSVCESSFGSRVGHLRGRLRLDGAVRDAWRDKLRAHNWRP